jgi:hypothetical protein
MDTWLGTYVIPSLFGNETVLDQRPLRGGCKSRYADGTQDREFAPFFTTCPRSCRCEYKEVPCVPIVDISLG